MVAGRKDKGFERVINCESCRETLVLLEPWFSPRPTSRVWCLYEILLTIMAGRTITVISPPEERAALSKALTEVLDSVQRVVGQVSAETAEATMDGDRTMIFAAIVKLLPRGFLDLENMVKDRLREWTYEAGEEMLAAMAPEERGTSKLINELALHFQNLEMQAAEGVPPAGAATERGRAVCSSGTRGGGEPASRGFEREVVAPALQAAGGDRELAANMLLG